MLLFLRRHLYKKEGVNQALLIVMAVSIVGIGSFSQMISLFWADTHTIFSVNGIGVSKPEFRLRTMAEKNVLNYYTQQLGDLAPQLLAQMGLSTSPEKNAYNKMVQELALSGCAQRSGLLVSPQVAARKAQEPMTLMGVFGQTLPRALYDRNGKIQEDILMRILTNLGITIEDFERLLEQSVEREMAVDLLRLAVPVPAWEIKCSCCARER